MERRTFLQSALAIPGLLVWQPAQGHRIIIVGAGLAGLAAAHELTRAGHQVTVLEARTRPGGRVYTLREPFSDGLYADAGAARIQDTHQYTLRYVKQFNLTLDPFFPTQGSTVTRVAGKTDPRTAANAGRSGTGPAAILRGGAEARPHRLPARYLFGHSCRRSAIPRFGGLARSLT